MVRFLMFALPDLAGASGTGNLDLGSQRQVV